MAGSQQQQIVDTIFSMKRRLVRTEDCKCRSISYVRSLLTTAASESEETETPYSNQKQSLKRKAQYTRSGDPDFLSDPRPYKKVRLRYPTSQGPR